MNGTAYKPNGTPLTLVEATNQIAQGVAGLSLHFGTDPVDITKLQYYVDCGNYPVYDQTEGIRIGAYVHASSVSPPPGWEPQGVISKGDGATSGYMLGIVPTPTGQKYEVHSGFVLRDVYGNTVLLHLVYPPFPPGPLPPWPPADDPRELRCGEWHHIATEFDGFEARLYLDGARVAATQLPNPPGHIIPAVGTQDYHHLCIGRMYYGLGGPPQWRAFEGLIDEPQVLSVAGGSHFQLPAGVPLGTSAPVVHFNAQGQLDSNYHAQAVYATVGDPYQTALLDQPIVAGDVLITLTSRNPFPAARGVVILGNPTAGYEVVTCTSANGLTLNVGGWPTVDPGAIGRGSYGTTPMDHSAGDTVYFARAVSVSMAGLVEQIKSAP
jgi:hypothetical protein